MSVNRIRNRIRFDKFSNLSEIALKTIQYRWSSDNDGVEVLVYNVVDPGERRKSVPIITVSPEGLSRTYIYSWLQRDHGIETGRNNYLIFDGVDFV
jgi:hypothetical protein